MHRPLKKSDSKNPQSPSQSQSQSLLPGLPDHLAQLCLSPILPSLLFSVCRSWRRLIYSPSFPSFLSLYAVLSQKDADDTETDPIAFYCFDPISSSWSQLPPPPPTPPLHSLLLRHPSFLSRSLPIQSVATADRLVLLAASNVHLVPALPRPLAFDPSSGRWSLGPLLRHPRRWCVAGSDAAAVYIASGVGSSYRSDVARSAERWEVGSGRWEAIAPLRDGRFSREATNAVAAGGKLCMVNVQGRGAKEGAVYDIGRDSWEEMPAGMVAGWTGPVAAGKGGGMYVVDETSGEVRGYNWGDDRWEVVAPAADERRGAVVAATGCGKICLAVDGGGTVEVVDLDRPERIWSVELPEGRRVIALHVLPRMRAEMVL